LLLTSERWQRRSAYSKLVGSDVDARNTLAQDHGQPDNLPSSDPSLEGGMSQAGSVADNRIYRDDALVRALVAQYKTPLYVFDEASIREKCRELKEAELCRRMGDDGLRRAAYRGGWKPA